MERRFSGEEWAVRRLVARDPTFRACWEDYEEALQAGDRWESSSADGGRRTHEYRTLIAELEDEIQTRLDAEDEKRGAS